MLPAMRVKGDSSSKELVAPRAGPSKALLELPLILTAGMSKTKSALPAQAKVGVFLS